MISLSSSRRLVGERAVDSNSLEKFEHEGVHLGCPLLLRPVPAAGQHDRPPKLRDERRQIRDELIHSREAHYEIAVAGDVEGGNGDDGAGERRQELPVAIDVAVPVEPAAKAGASELTGVEVDVGGGQPRWQSIRIGRLIEKAA